MRALLKKTERQGWSCPAKYYDGHTWHWCERDKVHQPYHEYALENGDVVQFDGRGMHRGMKATINPDATSASEGKVETTKQEEEAKRVKDIEDGISPILAWPLENRLMLLRHMRLQDDLEHVSTALRDLEVSIAVERRKKRAG